MSRSQSVLPELVREFGRCLFGLSMPTVMTDADLCEWLSVYLSGPGWAVSQVRIVDGETWNTDGVLPSYGARQLDIGQHAKGLDAQHELLGCFFHRNTIAQCSWLEHAPIT